MARYPPGKEPNIAPLSSHMSTQRYGGQGRHSAKHKRRREEGLDKNTPGNDPLEEIWGSECVGFSAPVVLFQPLMQLSVAQSVCSRKLSINSSALEHTLGKVSLFLGQYSRAL